MIFDGAPFCSSYGWNGFYLNDTAHHIRLSNLEIKNFTGQIYGGSSHGVYTVNPSHHIEILNSNIHHNGNAAASVLDHGLYINSDDSLFEGNLIHDNAGQGLQFWGYPDTNRNIFRRNRVYSNGTMGFAVKGFDHLIYNNLFYNNANIGIAIGYGTIGSSRNQIYNNVVYNNNYGITVGAYASSAPTDNVVQNNIVMNNAARGISICGTYSGFCAAYPPDGTIIQYNLLYGNGFANAILNEGTNSTISNNTIADPKLINAAGGDFYLQSISPAINTGADLSSTFTTDFFGATRVLPFDIGAFEYGGTVTPTPTPTPAPTPTPLAGDLNGDRVINSIDFSIMNGAWLTNNATSDLNKDGIVNSLDFSIMNGNWLKTY